MTAGEVESRIVFGHAVDGRDSSRSTLVVVDVGAKRLLVARARVGRHCGLG